jgi:hypothetical protein
MKNLFPSITIVFLLSIAISCKKHKDPSPQFKDITATTCKLESFNSERYTVQYGVDNHVAEIYEHIPNYKDPTVINTELRWRFQYENGFLRRVLRGKLLAFGTNTGEPYISLKFDYGPYGIEKVYGYNDDGGLADRYEFKFESSDKPTSMIQYFNFNYTHSSEDMQVVCSYKYEYDKNGNMVKEYRHYPNSGVNCVASYKYDNSPNSVKLFESFLFSSTSAAAVFSANNMVESEVVYDNSQPKNTIVTNFDPENKSVMYYNTLSAIKWSCK